MPKKEDVASKVKKVISELRPQLQMDGGDISFISYKDGVVKVKLEGACRGCPHAEETLKHGVEAMLKEKIKEVKKVEQA